MDRSIVISLILFFCFIVFGIVSDYVREHNEMRKDLESLRKILSGYHDIDKGIAAKKRELQTLEMSQRRKAEDEFRQHQESCQALRAKTEAELTRLTAKLDSERRKAENEMNQLAAALDKERKKVEEFSGIARSNLTAIPYMAAIIADFDTRELELFAKNLDWGSNQQRLKKVKSLRELRKETSALIAKSKEAEYQLEYALQMFPALEDFLDTDYRDIKKLELGHEDIIDAENHDTVREFLSKEEYQNLSVTERNQLALDRYWQSRRKSKWQVGRDYEMYVGYRYGQKGYQIDYYGVNQGLEDLGRDLIAKKDDSTLIIQCKYWSAKKMIHENHINQLFGTTISYCIENDVPKDNVQGVFITNIALSETAKTFANNLGITVVEHYPIGPYPCIKCNVNHSKTGEITKIYHLPFDQQYDSCKIDKPDEFFAMTVEEAEKAGFRRAYHWHGYEV